MFGGAVVCAGEQRDRFVVVLAERMYVQPGATDDVPQAAVRACMVTGTGEAVALIRDASR